MGSGLGSLWQHGMPENGAERSERVGGRSGITVSIYFIVSAALVNGVFDPHLKFKSYMDVGLTRIPRKAKLRIPWEQIENLLALIRIDSTCRWWYGAQSVASVKWSCVSCGSCGTDGAGLITAEFCIHSTLLGMFPLAPTVLTKSMRRCTCQN